MFFASITKRTVAFAAQTSGVRVFPRSLQTLAANHGTPAAQVTYPEDRWRPVRNLVVFRRDISSSTDAHIPMPVAAPGLVVVTPTAGLVDVFAPVVSVVLQTQITPTAGLVDVFAPAVGVSHPRNVTPTAGLVDVLAPTPLVVLQTQITPTAGLVDVFAPTVMAGIAGVYTPSAGIVEVTAPTLSVVLQIQITPTAGLVDVFAPTLSLDLGTRTILLTAASFAVLAPTIQAVYGQLNESLPPRTLADLDLSPPNVITQTTYELTIGGALGLPAVTIPALSVDITKRRYETQRPIFGYSPSGTVPIPHDTGVYLSVNLGVSWQYVPLPQFPGVTNISQPVFAERGGRGYLWFADSFAKVARYDMAARSVELATFLGPAGDLALLRQSYGLAVAPGASAIVLYASGQQAGIWRSTDNGLTFALANRGQGDNLGGYSVAFHPVVAGLCYAGGFATGTTGAPLYRSTDAGVTWTLASTLLLAYGSISRIALGVDPDIVYVRTRTAILKSLDQGATFATIHTGLPADFTDPLLFGLGIGSSSLAVSQSNEDILYTAVGVPEPIPERHVYRSTDAGATWTLRSELPPGQNGPIVTDLALHPTDPDRAALATFAPLSVPGVQLTSDGGTSWTIADADQGVGSVPATTAALFGVAYGVVGASVMMAVTGRHLPTNGPLPQKIRIGTETLFGELHEVTVTVPFSAVVVAAIDARTVTGVDGTNPIFPSLRIDIVFHYRSGAIRKMRLAEVQMTRLDVVEGSGDRQLSLSGRQVHENIARGPQTTRVVLRTGIESIDESAAEFSVTLPGIKTEWQTYDSILVNDRPQRISAIRYSITTDRRATILGFSVIDSAALDPEAESATAHPRLIIGRTPTGLRRGSSLRRRVVWRP